MTRSEEFYERMYLFAVNSLSLIKTLPRASHNTEYGKQLIRSSASIGANYIEALEGLSKKDFAHRLRVCRKEARESVHWLRLISDANTPNSSRALSI